jgi:hypothetical protein
MTRRRVSPQGERIIARYFERLERDLGPAAYAEHMDRIRGMIERGRLRARLLRERVRQAEERTRAAEDRTE